MHVSFNSRGSSTVLGSGQRLKNPIHDYRLLSNLYGDVEFGYMGDRFQNRQVAALSPRASISSFNPDVDYKMPKSIVIGAGAVVGRANRGGGFNTGGNQGGGTKKQGLVGTTNMRVGLVPFVRTRSDGGDSRNWIFSINQLGGVGRRWGQAAGPGNRGGVYAPVVHRLMHESRVRHPLRIKQTTGYGQPHIFRSNHRPFLGSQKEYEFRGAYITMYANCFDCTGQQGDGQGCGATGPYCPVAKACRLNQWGLNTNMSIKGRLKDWGQRPPTHLIFFTGDAWQNDCTQHTGALDFLLRDESFTGPMRPSYQSAGRLGKLKKAVGVRKVYLCVGGDGLRHGPDYWTKDIFDMLMRGRQDDEASYPPSPGCVSTSFEKLGFAGQLKHLQYDGVCFDIEKVATDLDAADYCTHWMELFKHLKSNGLDVMVTMSYFAGDFASYLSTGVVNNKAGEPGAPACLMYSILKNASEGKNDVDILSPQLYGGGEVEWTVDTTPVSNKSWKGMPNGLQHPPIQDANAAPLGTSLQTMYRAAAQGDYQGLHIVPSISWAGGLTERTVEAWQSDTGLDATLKGAFQFYEDSQTGGPYPVV